MSSLGDLVRPTARYVAAAIFGLGGLVGCGQRLPAPARDSSDASVASSAEDASAVRTTAEERRSETSSDLPTEPANPPAPSNAAPASTVALSPATEDGGIEESKSTVSSLKPRSDDDPVSARLSVSQERVAPGGMFEVQVVLDVDPGYEIYRLGAAPPKVPTRLELELPDGFVASEGWRSPATVRSFGPQGEAVHRGEATFVRTITVAADALPGDHRIGCTVSYQACDSRRCLRPISASLDVGISLAR